MNEGNRYGTTQVFVEQSTGEAWLGTRIPLDLPVADDDEYVQWKDGDAYDAIAFRAWGDTFGDNASRLWWVICDLNGIINPLDPPPDTSRPLRLPSAARLLLQVMG